MIGLCSRKIAAIPYLDKFLDSDFTLLPSSEKPEAVAGWGRKPTANRARAMAAKLNLPYISLEDGFLRSLGLGAYFPPISIIVDHAGIYYDSTRESDLENLLNTVGWESAELISSAQKGISSIIKYNLSKYNHAPEAPSDLLGGDAPKKVLILDQTKNDMSIVYGGGFESTFTKMIYTALEENPGADIFVKIHPDVINGKKSGYLYKKEFINKVKLIDKDFAPLSLLRQADLVYTVTSQMGFEALLLGKEVHCFGIPFYSGWGLTVDRIKCPRRTRKRSLEELFAAAYILYARYVNPFTGKRCDIHEAIQILSDQRRQNEANRGLNICVGLSRWKRGLARSYLKSTDSRIEFHKKIDHAFRAAKEKSGKLVIWASREPEGLEESCQTDGVELVRMEDGFIRSVGLGSEFNYPFSLVFDEKGIYYDPSRPNTLESILQHYDFTEEIIERAACLRKNIVDNSITKYNIDTDEGFNTEKKTDLPVILVIGQVEDDASVRLGGCGINTNFELLQAVKSCNPDKYIIYKPHPDVLSGNRHGLHNPLEIKELVNEIALRGNLTKWLTRVDEVHTLTSLSGFESLLRGIPVHTYGGPFYAGWGLTNDRVKFPRRNRKLSVDELVAGTLILYASYFDWVTDNACTPEAVIHRLMNGGLPTRLQMRRQIFLGVRNLMRRFNIIR